MDLGALQAQIAATFGDRDRARGVDGTFRRLVEEIGEVAKAIRGGDRVALASELSDVLAWTLSVAVLCDVDLYRGVACSANSGSCAGSSWRVSCRRTCTSCCFLDTATISVTLARYVSGAYL